MMHEQYQEDLVFHYSIRPHLRLYNAVEEESKQDRHNILFLNDSLGLCTITTVWCEGRETKQKAQMSMLNYFF